MSIGGATANPRGIATVGNNIYVILTYSGAARVGQFPVVSKGTSSALTAKLASDGKPVWAKSFNAVGAQSLLGVGGDAIATGTRGDVVFAGSFGGAADFDGTRLKSRGSQDVFVARHDQAGHIVWATAAGGDGNNIRPGAADSGWDSAAGVALHPSGDVFVAGEFDAVADFQTQRLRSAGEWDVFVARLDGKGKVIWSASGGGRGRDSATAISVDSIGNSYITGTFEDRADFGSTRLVSQGRSAAFIAKLDPTGRFVWAKSLGGSGLDAGHGIAVDGDRNVYVTGTFSKRVDPFGCAALTAKGAGDAFVAKVSTHGTCFWARAFGGEVPTRIDGGGGIATHPSGVVTTGWFAGTARIDGKVLASRGELDVFVLNLDSAGHAVWLTGAGGSGESVGRAVTVDSARNVYVTGYVSPTAAGTASFGGASVHLGTTSAFVWKLPMAP